MRKKKIPQFNKIHVIQFPEGEFKPLYVAAHKIDKIIIGVSQSTWANWRSLKIGPRYYRVRNRIYYKISELEEFFEKNPIQTVDTI